MKLSQAIILILASVVITIAVGFFFFVPKGTTFAPTATQKETAYERVMRTKTLRCGYINYPPHFIIDPNTGKKSGITYDIMEEAARLLRVKVEWAEELGYATTVTAIQNGRVDAICTSFWQNPQEGKYLGFTMPLFYSPVDAYARADDGRFTGNLQNINNKNIKVSASDNNMAFLIAQQDYPKATILSLPNMTDETQLLMDVESGKADVTFIETYLAEKFIKNHPGKLEKISMDAPVRLFGNTIAIPNDDLPLKTMLDSALVQLLYGGTIEKILLKYEEIPGGIYRVAKPYEVAR